MFLFSLQISVCKREFETEYIQIYFHTSLLIPTIKNVSPIQHVSLSSTKRIHYSNTVKHFTLKTFLSSAQRRSFYSYNQPFPSTSLNKALVLSALHNQWLQGISFQRVELATGFIWQLISTHPDDQCTFIFCLYIIIFLHGFVLVILLKKSQF